MYNKYNFNAYQVFALLGLFFIFSLCLLVKSSYSYGAVIISLTSIIHFINKKKLILNQQQKYIFWVFSSYVFILIAINIYKSETGHAYEYPIRILLMLLCLPLFKVLKVNLTHLCVLISIGLLLSNSLVLYDLLINHTPRASNGLNPIFYGELCLLFSFLLIQGILYNRKSVENIKFLTILYSLGSLFGLLGMFISGSRGSWIAVPFLVVLMLLTTERDNKKIFFIIVAVFISATFISYLIPQTGVKQRIEHAQQEISNYYRNDDVSSSIGLRLGLWKISHLFIEQKPILGWKESELAQEKNKLIESGKISSELRNIGHFHNQYMESIVYYGLVGLVAFILILFIPLILFISPLLFYRGLNNRNICISGIATVGCYMIFSLTDILIQFNIGITIYITLILYLISILGEKP